jgi:hypothetical protein
MDMVSRKVVKRVPLSGCEEAPPLPYPTVVPGTFEFLVAAPN